MDNEAEREGEEGGRRSNSRALLSFYPLLSSVPPVAAFVGEEIDRGKEDRQAGRGRKEGRRPYLL